MNTVEIRAAINFGKEYIEWCKKNNQEPASWAYDRLIELYEQLLYEQFKEQLEQFNIGD